MEALELIGEWPVDHAVAGAVAIDVTRTTGGTEPVARVETAGATTRAFAWASVTKLATALAVLIAVEEGTVALEDAAGPPNATVRHLLAHASGLGPDPGPPVAAPGADRIYSNAGYLILAEVLEARSEMPFPEYLHHGVLDPLGMTSTTLTPATSDGAAAGLTGPVDDLLALAGELLVPSLISSETLCEATSVQFPGLAGVLPGYRRYDPCDWGLGPELRGHKQPHWTGASNSAATSGHFGRSGSFLWVDPVAGIACVASADRPFGPWAQRCWPVLSDAVLAEHAGHGRDVLA